MAWSRMSVFDLDHTLVTGSSSFAFCQYLVSRGILPRSSMAYAALCYIRHTFFKMPLVDLHQKIFNQLLRGLPVSILEQHAEPFVEQYLATHSNRSVFNRLRLAQHVGDYTFILSNSPSFLVSVFARFLGVDDWRATHYATDHEKKLSSIALILQGEEKAACVEETIHRLAIDKKDVTAYSDSYLDLPFLMAAGTPIAVNPDRKLRKISETNQWKML